MQDLVLKKVPCNLDLYFQPGDTFYLVERASNGSITSICKYFVYAIEIRGIIGKELWDRNDIEDVSSYRPYSINYRLITSRGSTSSISSTEIRNCIERKTIFIKDEDVEEEIVKSITQDNAETSSTE